MPAYFISDFEVTDPQTFGEYQKAAAPFVAEYGGRLLAAGPPADALDAGWQPKGLAIIEFPSVDHIHQWFADPEYQQVAQLRLRSSTGKVVIINGYSPQH